MESRISKLFVYFVLALSFNISGVLSRDKKENCQTCKDIGDAFYKGMEKTVKANFGGGNTAWEERKLGSYATSETRLVEIVESLCDSSECHAMVEEYEETLEEWWFKLQSKEKDLKTWLCINKIKVCCPNGTYGSNCEECPVGKDRPCNSHGDCQGEGTRTGTGKCSCHDGYEGDTCDECKDDYFEETDENDKMKCTACHESCDKGCSGSTPKDCTACKAGWGWEQSDEEGCKDVDECKEGDTCKGGEYCVNTPGSYTCEECHESCQGNCTTAGAKGCQECKSGYTMSEEEGCKDNDECAADETSLLCSAGEYCKNTPGSYECSNCNEACETCIGEGQGSCSKCNPGYEMKDDGCKDIDECSAEQNPCDPDKETCKNNPGSYTCDCRSGYQRKGDKCVKRKGETKKEEDDEDEEDTDKKHDEKHDDDDKKHDDDDKKHDDDNDDDKKPDDDDENDDANDDDKEDEKDGEGRKENQDKKEEMHEEL